MKIQQMNPIFSSELDCFSGKQSKSLFLLLYCLFIVNNWFIVSVFSAILWMTIQILLQENSFALLHLHSPKAVFLRSPFFFFMFIFLQTDSDTSTLKQRIIRRSAFQWFRREFVFITKFSWAGCWFLDSAKKTYASRVFYVNQNARKAFRSMVDEIIVLRQSVWEIERIDGEHCKGIFYDKKAHMPIDITVNTYLCAPKLAGMAPNTASACGRWKQPGRILPASSPDPGSCGEVRVRRSFRP